MLQSTWSDQCTKNILQHLLGAIRLGRAYLMTSFPTPLPLVWICTHLEWTPFCVCDFIDLILPSPILTLLVCYSFLILFYFRKWRIDVFVSDTHQLLVSHSVSSSLPRKAFSLMVASNYQLFYLSWSLTKLSYVNVKESYSRRTTTVIVTVLMKALSFS